MAELEMNYEKEKGEDISLNIQRLIEQQIQTQNDHPQFSPSICYLNKQLKGCNRSYKKTAITTGVYDSASSSIPNQELSSIKATYTLDLFRRLESNSSENVRQCVRMVYAKIDQIRACYSLKYGYLINKNDYDFTYVIVLSACFIIELIHKWSEDNNNLRDISDSHYKTYISLRQVKQDLILLHNQIPFFILQDIFDFTVKKIKPNASLIKLVLSFFKEINPFEPNPNVDDDYGTDANTNTSYKHILDLLYKYHHRGHISLYPSSTVTASYSAIDLAKAGVHFMPNDKTTLTMRFKSTWTHCTLTMPVLRIEEHTELLLFNLTCYERCFPEVGNYMASYLYALMMLVDSKEDLLKLVESKIITNQSGHQHIVDLIHEFAIEFVPVQFIYSIHWRAMGDYYNKFAGYTRRTYFSGAWSYIASATALILFIFTAVQTYCSVRNL